MNTKKVVTEYRQKFPILDRKVNGKTLIYFDNAATTQKPFMVISALTKHYENSHANVHRASHTLSSEATMAFEKSRKKVKDFIGAASIKEIIWTKGATESINLVAQTWGLANLKPGDEVLLSYSEHHANIVPWQMVAEITGALIKVAPLTVAGLIDFDAFNDLISPRTKLIACTHISNVVGKVNDLAKLIELAQARNIVTLIDGSQAVAHTPINVQALGCDFYVFSAHKMYGPNGVGVLYGRQKLLSNMPPYQGGGEMIEKVSFTQTTYAELPFKFEPGTPNISGVVAFTQAIDFIETETTLIKKYKSQITDYAYKNLNEINELQFLFTGKPDIPLFSFTLNTAHNYDVATYLNAQGIAIRSGHHCAMPLMEYKQVTGCIRVSLAPYNTFAEVDSLVTALKVFIQQDVDEDSERKHKADLLLAEQDLELSSMASSSQPRKLLGDESKLERQRNISSAQKDMEAHFTGAHSWDSRHRLIMLLGKKLTRLSADDKTMEHLIEGCESSAWLIYEVIENNKGEKSLFFKGDSDAKVIRGLLLIVFSALNCLSPEDILNIDMPAYFQRLGLLTHLSPSRGNGLNAIVNKVMKIAQEHS